MTPPYTVDYFIQKFEAIPEEKWTTQVYRDGDSCCVLGHCGVYNVYTDEANALSKIILDNLHRSVADINDGFSSTFTQPTPKARILAALRDIQKKQEG